MTVTLIVPALNELATIPAIMSQVDRKWCDQTIFLLGKPVLDDTPRWCRANGYECFIGEENLWLGYRNLFLSRRVKGDVVITFSPDNNSPPEAIPKLIYAMNQPAYNFDMVIASRYKGTAKSTDDSRTTRFGNWMFTNLVNLGGRKKFTDALVMYRAYRREIVYELGMLRWPSRLQRKLIATSPLYSWEPSLSIRAVQTGLKVAEIPVDEPKALRERRQSILRHGSVILTQIIHEKWLRQIGV